MLVFVMPTKSAHPAAAQSIAPSPRQIAMKRMGLLAVVTVATLSGCDWSETSGRNSAAGQLRPSWIIGRWAEENCVPTEVLEFHADGRFSGEGRSGTWRLEAETLTIVMSGGRSDVFVVRNLNGILVVSEPNTPDEVTDILRRC